MYCRRTNFWVNESVSILIQVFFVFAFLTFFFFGYVVTVEEEEFENQLRLVVDSLAKDVKGELAGVIRDKKILKNQEIPMLVGGAIGIVQDRIERSSKDVKEKIRADNRALRNRVYMALGIFAGAVVFVVGAVMAMGFCVPLRSYVKTSAIIVLVVGLTEFAFLKFIAGKYVAADPNAIKRTLGDTLSQWIKDTYPEKIG